MTLHRNLLFDFTHTYPEHVEDQDHLIRLDCSHLQGCRDYCSQESKQKLKNMIKPYGVSGIHFLDSGDYHYITELMTDFIKEPFTLVLIDHHTDMQESLIRGLTSCGNWAEEVLKKNSYLKQLVLIGQEQQPINIETQAYPDKVLGISYDQLQRDRCPENASRKCALAAIDASYPVYLSIDKDVLREEDACTNWDQGKMSMDMLENILHYLVMNHEIIGVDICGEYPKDGNIPEYVHAQRINKKADEEIYHCLRKLCRRKKKLQTDVRPS